MGHRNRNQGKRQKPRSSALPTTAFKTPLAVVARKPLVEYGKPFILLEDYQKSTFIYKGGQWIPHATTIAECRQDCQVKELPQKINGMTRYEVCSPVSTTV